MTKVTCFVVANLCFYALRLGCLEALRTFTTKQDICSALPSSSLSAIDSRLFEIDTFARRKIQVLLVTKRMTLISKVNFGDLLVP